MIRFLLVIALAIAFTSPALSRGAQNTTDDDFNRCVSNCKKGCDRPENPCDSDCRVYCRVDNVHPTTGTYEAAPDPQAQVCCRTGRRKFTYSWTKRDLCKPPNRTIMQTPAKCPLQRSQ